MFASGPSAREQIGSFRGERLYHAGPDGAEDRTQFVGDAVA
jgi:hypothetical protein